MCGIWSFLIDYEDDVQQRATAGATAGAAPDSLQT